MVIGTKVGWLPKTTVINKEQPSLRNIQVRNVLRDFFIRSLAAFMDKTSPDISDITKAYIQSATSLRRRYTSGLEGAERTTGRDTQARQSLIRNSGLRSSLALDIPEHYISALNMIQSRVRPCLLFQR